jgi:peptidoglycan/xylan/chitin deacetylase (PgdA/CDA1 family)
MITKGRHLLMFQEELKGDRDAIHNFEAQHSDRYRDASHCRPVLDEELLARNPGVAESLRWPNGCKFAALLSHDVDGTRENSREQLWRTILAQCDSAASLNDKIRNLLCISGLRHSPGHQDLVSPWLDAERKRNFTSTFFVFPSYVLPRHRIDLNYFWDDEMPFEGKLQTIQSVFSQVASRGWEIGLHGSIESAFTPGMLETQRLDIEKAVGSRVVSGRQHNLQFGAAVTPDLIAASGLKVDCTLGSNRTAFFRTGTSYPHKLWSVSKKDWLDVLEIPLVLHDGALLRADNLDLSPDSAFRFCRKIIERAAAVRGVVSLLWHPENILKPGYFELYCRLLDLLEEMGAWGTSARQIADWWQSSGNAKIVEVAMEENLSEVKV